MQRYSTIHFYLTASCVKNFKTIITLFYFFRKNYTEVKCSVRDDLLFITKVE